MRIFRVIVLTVLFLLGVADESLADDYISVSEWYKDLAVVKCNKFLNIRIEPDDGSDIIGIVPNEGACCIIKEGNEWCAVKSGEVVGYVMKKYLVMGEEAEELATAKSVRKLKFNDTGVVYSDANVDSKIWERPVRGSIYDVVKDDGEWAEISFSGATGYVHLNSSNVVRFMGLSEASYTHNAKSLHGTRKRLVEYAMSFLGNEYVWGGNDPHTGADCSGFVRYVYNKICPEIYLPRVSYEQCYYGDKISSLDMQAGDLLFYANSLGVVHHVAMYIGNGTIIHAASSTQGIILSQWNYQTPKYIRCLIGE